MWQLRRITMATAVGVAGLVLASCGGGDGATASADEPLTVTMDEYSFDPVDITIPAGEQVTLEFVNDGGIDHEFMAGQGVRGEDSGSPDGFEQDLFADIDVTVDPASAEMMEMGDSDSDGDDTAATEDDGAEGDEGDEDEETEEAEDDGHGDDDHGFMVVVEPGQTASMTFTLPADLAGDWIMGCFEQNGLHWNEGMKGTITVTE